MTTTTAQFTCVECGYDLRGHVLAAFAADQACPECGLPVRESQIETLHGRFYQSDLPELARGARWLLRSHLLFLVIFGIVIFSSMEFELKIVLGQTLVAWCAIASVIAMRRIVAHSRLLERQAIARRIARFARTISTLPCVAALFVMINLGVSLVQPQLAMAILVVAWVPCAIVTYLHFGVAFRHAGARWWGRLSELVAMVVPLSLAYPLILILMEVVKQGREQPDEGFLGISILTFGATYLAALAVLVGITRLKHCA